MKKVLLKTLLIGLGCASAMNALALAFPAQTLPTFGNLPLYFEAASTAQADHPAQFIARGGNSQVLILPNGVRLELKKMNATTGNASLRTVQMQFVGAGSHPQIQGADELPGKVNYLIGNNPAQWRTGVATYARVQVEQLYPGINLAYYGNQRQLEYDFAIAPGTNPNTIKIHFDGVDKITIGANGELMLALGGGEICQPAPVIYQTVHGQRQIISGGYRLMDAHTVAFAVGKYNHRLPLVIDPILTYSTYFGGSGSDTAWKMVRDTNGFIYIAGQTTSAGLATSNAFQKINLGGSYTGDAFVAKLDDSGTNLIYFTYLGGSDDDFAYGLAVDDSGDVFLTGATASPDFPTANALFPQLRGHYYGQGIYNPNAFVAELGPSGSNLIYSTYLGGSGFVGTAKKAGSGDEGLGIALDTAGNAYVTGFTSSSDFPVANPLVWQLSGTSNVFNHLAGIYNAFVTKIGPGGSNLLYSTYFGGTNTDVALGVVADSAGAVYLAGYTDSPNFPTNHPVQPRFGGATTPATSYDAFVARFAQPTTTNLSLDYSTFLGGTNSDLGYGIVVDTNSNAYVVGGTASPNFPNTATNVPGLYEGVTNNLTAGSPTITNAFLTQITWNGTNAGIGYSAVFGGAKKGIDVGYGVALDPFGDAFVVGASSTTSFPITNAPALLGTANAGRSDAFVIGFNTNCSAVLYSGYLGGSGNDYGYAVAVDALTNVYVVGQTASVNFPTVHPYQSSLKGPSDAFLAKIGWVNQPPEFTTEPTNRAVAVGTTVSLVSAVTGTAPLTYQWQMQGTNLIWRNLVNGGTNSTGFGVHITGATNTTLTISDSQTEDSGNYRIVVTNYAGSVTSLVAVVTVTNAPTVLTEQPASQTVGVGSTVRFFVNGSAQPPYLLQWLKDGIDLTNGTNISGSIISGATNSGTLTINNVQTNDAGNYWLVISNAWGVLASSNATLTVVSFPTILVPPTNQTVGLGSTVNLAVTAVGAAPLSYQWQLDGVNLVNGGRISGGVTSSTLTITNVQTADDGGYSVVVTNSVGSVTSSPPAVLTVLTVPTFLGITAGTNGSIIFSGTGGTNGGTYLVYASTNLALPLNQWTAILVSGNKFGSQGQFAFTNMPPANIPQRFYILELPPP